MANQEHFDILKQGVEVWNRWRATNPKTTPNLILADLNNAKLNGAQFHGVDLAGADLSHASLNCAHFSNANLIRTNLQNANLKSANFIGADIRYANLCDANLCNADLIGANLKSANLTSAHPRGAYLRGADLLDAQLGRANLDQADLSYAIINRADLQGATFVKAMIGFTSFADNDLSSTKGLAEILHKGPSSIGTDTFHRSRGYIPEVFLRGCGLQDWEIESAKLYRPNLSNEEINDIYYRIHDLRVRRAFQINPLFISYSHADNAFVDAIDKHLTKQGVRFWRDIHDAKAGRLETQIDRAIHLNNVVLLILSEHSTDSDWIEHEARKAREKEKETGKDTLCPVALDDSWKTCRWPARLREQITEYNILDFSNWQDDTHFQKMFSKLLEGLNLFYK